MTGLGIAIVLVVLLAVVWHEGKQPARHSNLSRGRLEKLLGVLLNQGYDGGVMFIEARRGRKVLQVAKYVGRGQVGLQLDFPRARWSSDYYESVRDALRERGAEYTEEPTGRADTSHFLSVDFGRDTATAVETIYALAEKALGIDLARDGIAYFVNVSPDPNARIGFETNARPNATS